MTEREGPAFFERFEHLHEAQVALERYGYFFQPIPREHVEALVTGPLLHRLHTAVKKRGFERLAGRVLITFSGFGLDAREIYEIPEARDYWRTLDRQLPELPALLATLPELGFNGPGLHLLLLGDVDAVEHAPAEGRYHAHVVQGAALTADALARIRQAGRKYHVREDRVRLLIEQFKRGAGAD